MYKLLLCMTLLILFVQASYAYKVFYYDENGKRVYVTVEQKEFSKYKNAPKRAYIRCPRRSWEITDSMRERKLTSSQMTHRY